MTNRLVSAVGEFTEEYVLNLAKKAYEEGVASFEIIREKCALLVMDMQDEFVRPHWTPFWVPEATRQVPKIRTLINVCRQKRIPVIFTSFALTYNSTDRPASGRLMPNRYNDVAQDPAWFRDGRIWHELTPLEGEIIIHKHPTEHFSIRLWKPFLGI